MLRELWILESTILQRPRLTSPHNSSILSRTGHVLQTEMAAFFSRPSFSRCFQEEFLLGVATTLRTPLPSLSPEGYINSTRQSSLEGSRRGVGFGMCSGKEGCTLARGRTRSAQFQLPSTPPSKQEAAGPSSEPTGQRVWPPLLPLRLACSSRSDLRSKRFMKGGCILK